VPSSNMSARGAMRALGLILETSMLARCALIVLLSAATASALAKECWALTGLKGHMANSADKYAFVPDKFTNPMVLCFNEDDTGSVSGDDTKFQRFGTSSLIGFVKNGGIELVESYQIDRVSGSVLFSKSRIGTATVLPGAPDVVGAFVGKATRLAE